jgi:AP-2 complex subunit alpha
MPAFPERESSVMRLLRAKQTDTTDKSAFKKDERAEGEVAEGEGEVEEERPRSGPAMGHGAAKAKEADLLSLDDALTSAPAPASSGRAAPVTSSSLLDDILSAPAPAAAPAPVHHAPAAAAPVSADDFFGPAPTSSAGGMMGMGSNVVDLNTVLGDAINNCYRALVLSDRGVLFENDHMQIGCVTEISGPQARVTLFLGNKANAPLTSLSATLDNSSFNPTELRCAAAAIPPMVAPRQQVQIIIQAQLAGFYDQVPRFTLSYMADGKEHRGVFNVPLPVTKFSVPIPIQGADAFFGRWRSIVGDGTEQQEVFKANPQRGVDVAYAQRVLSQGLRMNVVQGVDPNPANVVSAGGIQTGTGQQCVILVRIESNAQSQAYRLTVRAQDARVARQLLQLVKTQL